MEQFKRRNLVLRKEYMKQTILVSKKGDEMYLKRQYMSINRRLVFSFVLICLIVEIGLCSYILDWRTIDNCGGTRSECRAVEGFASNAGDVNNFGGYFKAWGRYGQGVYGRADGNDGYGVCGHASGDEAKGAYSYVPGVNGRGVQSRGQEYDFYAQEPGTNYGARSSIRWKRNIQPTANPLDKILQLRGVYFSWDAEHGGDHDVGMIAEEVGKVLPEIVQYEQDGIYTRGMDYSKLTPLLVEAVKVLKVGG